MKKFSHDRIFKAALALVILLLLFYSCKKVDYELLSTGTQKIDEFLKIPESSSKELKLLIADVRQQLQKNDFVNDFIQLDGKPLWNKAIKEIKNSNNFSLFIPTVKDNRIATFFIIKYYYGKFYYEMHQRSSIENGVKEYSALGFKDFQNETILNFFEQTVFSKKYFSLKSLHPCILKNERIINQTMNSVFNNGTFFEKAKNINPNVQEGECITICETVEIWWNPDGDPCNCNGDEYYLYDLTTCDDFCGGGWGGGSGGGGGGSGGGGGCPWWNPGCFPPPGVQPNPCQVIDSLMSTNAFTMHYNELKNDLSLNYEKAFVFLFPFSQTPIYQYVPNGIPNDLSVTVNPSVPIDGVAHNHNIDPKALSVFSADDFFNLYDIFDTHRIVDYRNFTFGVVGQNSSYIMMITDTTQFRYFGDNFLKVGNEAIFKNAFYNGYHIHEDSTITSNEKHLLQALQNLNSGIKIFKGNNTLTNFTPIGLDNNRNVITVPCLEQ
ncbi:MAG: hypothetical protein NTX08_00330 [Sphingobacteriales bacterium]|nr:hypothetical protein [Sphingobacteriales bacterium]